MQSTIKILVAVVTAAKFRQGCLTASLLAVGNDPHRIYLPLCIFFIANAVAKLNGAVEVLAATRRTRPFRHIVYLKSILGFPLISPFILGCRLRPNHGLTRYASTGA